MNSKYKKHIFNMLNNELKKKKRPYFFAHIGLIVIVFRKVSRLGRGAVIPGILFWNNCFLTHLLDTAISGSPFRSLHIFILILYYITVAQNGEISFNFEIKTVAIKTPT